ncbi:O-antigen ligase family protein [Pollutibacter soli]|uniref:O-antigen ligase family protein n=1 Tax=Pollutibacter soli TaxID=3034157 RepID=UPI0030132BD3
MSTEIPVQNNKSFYWILTVFLFSSILQDLLHLPPPFGKIQLAEIIFVPFLLFYPYHIIKRFRTGGTEKRLLLFLSVYLLVNFAGAIKSGSIPSLFETAGRFYLALSFVMIVIYFDQFSRQELIFYFTNICFAMSWILALLGISGYLVQLSGMENSFVIRLDDYPYIGTVFRLKGPTFTPTMFCTLLTPGIFLGLFNFKTLHYRPSIKKILFAVILIAAFFSFSKSFFIILWGIFLWWLYIKQWLKAPIALLTSIPLIIFLFIATHFVFAEPGTEKYERYMQTTFISDQSAFEVGKLKALETSYYLNKKIAIGIFPQHFLIGIGPGNFNSVVDDYKSMGMYPERFFSYDPHSAWLGAIAENGILGFFAILLFILILYLPLTKFSRFAKYEERCACFIIFSFFIIEGIATDIFNFRHLWIFFAVCFLILRKSSVKTEFQDPVS